jgi:Zn-dependent protease with chaperone function
MDITDLLITLTSIPIVAATAFIFGRNPYRWALYAYFIKFWCLIPLFLLSKRPTPPLPAWIQQLAVEVRTRKELREVKKIQTPEDLFRSEL